MALEAIGAIDVKAETCVVCEDASSLPELSPSISKPRTQEGVGEPKRRSVKTNAWVKHKPETGELQRLDIDESTSRLGPDFTTNNHDARDAPQEIERLDTSVAGASVAADENADTSATVFVNPEEIINRKFEWTDYSK